MKNSVNKYFIEQKKLISGTYEKLFEIDDDFFDFFDYDEIRSHNLQVNIEYEIKSSLILAKMKISGFVEIQCDICGEFYNQKIENEIELVFKKVDDVPSEDTFDELIYYSPEDETIDLKKIIFDYIVLSIPLKKEHPRDENGKRTCNTEITKYLKFDLDKNNNFENLANWEEIKKNFNY